jgi:hypothetical protein
MTTTFSGIRRVDVPGFLVAQFVGGIIATAVAAVSRRMLPT